MSPGDPEFEHWSEADNMSTVALVGEPLKQMDEMARQLHGENGVRDATSDFESFLEFYDEWKEEKENFMHGIIESRPLHSLLHMMALDEPEAEGDNIMRDCFMEMDTVLTRRCRSLELVRQRDVKASQKRWKCEAVLYVPPKNEWVDFEK